MQYVFNTPQKILSRVQYQGKKSYGFLTNSNYSQYKITGTFNWKSTIKMGCFVLGQNNTKINDKHGNQEIILFKEAEKTSNQILNVGLKVSVGDNLIYIIWKKAIVILLP